MSKIKCRKCGFENDEDNNYCIECGNSLNKGFFSKIKNLFSSKNDKVIFKDYKEKRIRIKQFNDKFSTSSTPDQYIDSTENILRKNKDIYDKLDDFKNLKLNQNDYESLDTFYYNYNNLDNIVENLNKKFLKNYYSTNKEKINNFLNLNEYIDDYKSILDNNKFLYKNLSYCKHPPDDIKKFIEKYENFEEVSKEINQKYIEDNLDLDNIKKFLNKYVINIDYTYKVDKDAVLLNYSKDYDLAKKIDNPTGEIKDFIKNYEDFANISENINKEIDGRKKIKRDFTLNLTKINKFITTYENPSDTEYIKSFTHILNQHRKQYELSLKLIEFEENKTANRFIVLFDNFENIAKSINQKYIRNLNNEFISLKSEIDVFINDFKTNISYNYIGEDEKQEILDKYKKHYEISSELIKIDKSNENKILINQFIKLYNNFENVVKSINDEYAKRSKIKEDFNNHEDEIIDFVDKYEKNISPDLYIDDPNDIVTNQKSNYTIVLDYKKYFNDNLDIINSFIDVYENFNDISFNINQKFCKNKYEKYLKNKELIQDQLTKFGDLTIEDYIKYKKSFIQDFLDIYSKFKEIILYNKYLNLSKEEFNFINQFIDLYDNFDVNFIEEYKNKYYQIELKSLDFVESYRFNIICADYIHDYKSILKEYETTYYLLKDIKKLEEIDFDVDDFIQVYENLDIIVEKTNKCYIKRTLNEFDLIKNDIIAFIQHFDNLQGYISEDKIIQDYAYKYEKFKEIQEIPNIENYFDNDYTLILNFISIYENYDEIILKHNMEYVNCYYNKYKSKIKQYIDVLEKKQEYYLSDSKLKQLTNDFKSILDIVKNLKNYLKDYKYLKETELIDNFPNKFNLSENEVKIINQYYINRELNENKEFFDTILEHPLDDNQRRAVVIDEDNTQIIAGAGTGKTYTLQAKVKYLIDKKGVSPDNILALSFSKLSVGDLQDQFDKIGININTSTFHSLGLSILRDNGINANVSEYDLDTAIKKYFTDYLLINPDKLDRIIKYFAYYIYTPLDMEEVENIGELYDYEDGYDLETFYSKFKKLKDPNLNRKTFQGEYVKSLEERMIANFLFLNGIKYKYETDYEPLINWQEAKSYLFNLFSCDEIPRYITTEFVYEMLEELEIDEEIYWPNGEKVNKYHPDFYLIDYGIYYEHFGVNRDCEAPWYPNNKRRRTYIQEMKNKRKLHKKYGTKLIETYSYYQSENRLLQRLEEKLKEAHVKFNPIDTKTFLMALLASEIKMNEYFEFIKLIKTFINLFKGNGYEKEKFIEFRKINEYSFKDFEFEKHELFLDIVEDIYDYYYAYLKENNKIDFNDMINDASKMIQDKGYSKNYSYIIVDEYQDTSHTRYNLLKYVKDYYNAKLIIVGDDWQSIYRFTGCDVDLFTNFKEYFGDTKTEICEIINTYRNSQSLIDISGKFIMKNNHQYKKHLVSKAPNQVEAPIKIVEYLNKKDQPFLFEYIIKKIYNNSENKNKVKILVLGRNNNDYKAVLHENLFTTRGSTENNTLKIIYHKNPKINIKFLTVHSSKGLEENNVVILNLEDKKAGFPNKMEDDSVLSFVKNERDEGIDFAEERRLFYVALTRTRNYSFLISPTTKKSIFVDELIEDNELVDSFTFEKMIEEDDEYDDEIRIISATNGVCPDCGTGKMVLKFNPKTGKSFFNCSNWSRCDWFGGRYFGDIDDMEDFVNCPECGGILIKRLNRLGEYFYGCVNYYPHELCRFTCNVEDIENPHYCPDCGELLVSGLSRVYRCTSEFCSFTCLVDKYDDIIQKRNELKEKELKDLIKKANKLEKNKKYEDAIEIYKKINNNFEACKRMCICYRKLKFYNEELNTIYKSIHNNSLSDKEKKFFKNRIKEFNFEKNSKNKIKIIESEKKCPECGKPIVLKIVEKRDIKYITCSEEDCYWFGGVYEGKIEDFESYMI